MSTVNAPLYSGFGGGFPELNFARSDPYVRNGLVTRWEVRSWTVVIGNEPEDPRPKGV